MKVTALLENRTISKEFKCRHGLSLYIETSKHNILFDVGPDDSYAYNAKKLGVNLENVDIAVLSHGHYDHGGGLETFLNINKKAKIYIGKGAFDDHLVKLLGVIKFDIGLKKKLISSDRFVFVDGLTKIDNELIIFGNVTGNKLKPKDNDRLLRKYENSRIKKDDFDHEINLIINENNKYSLFCGCAHNGIINIAERAKEIINDDLSTVIGGFHLMRMDVKNSDSKEFLDELSTLLNNTVSKYYTCHCTSEQSYRYLSQRMSNLNDLKTGMIIEV